MIVHGKNTKTYSYVDVKEDSQPADFSTLQHFFANHYNQLMTILIDWQVGTGQEEEEANK